MCLDKRLGWLPIGARLLLSGLSGLGLSLGISMPLMVLAAGDSVLITHW